MLVREYLHQSGATADDLAKFLGHKTTASVTKKLESEMPKRWERLLNEGQPSDSPSAVGGKENDTEFDARSQTKPTQLDDDFSWDTAGRETDGNPTTEEDYNRVVGPQKIKLTTVEGYIQQIYSGAAYLAHQRGDDIAADTINRYSPEFAEAWINYIQSDPRIMEWLEKLMVGTPLGNLIGVHVIAVGSYTFARVAARQLAEFAVSDSGVNGNGTPESSTANSLG